MSTLCIFQWNYPQLNIAIEQSCFTKCVWQPQQGPFLSEILCKSFFTKSHHRVAESDHMVNVICKSAMMPPGPWCGLVNFNSHMKPAKENACTFFMLT